VLSCWAEKKNQNFGWNFFRLRFARLNSMCRQTFPRSAKLACLTQDVDAQAWARKGEIGEDRYG